MPSFFQNGRTPTVAPCLCKAGSGSIASESVSWQIFQVLSKTTSWPLSPAAWRPAFHERWQPPSREQLLRLPFAEFVPAWPELQFSLPQEGEQQAVTPPSYSKRLALNLPAQLPGPTP